ncbi:MAG: PorV/PorQ family protein [Candidatus Edwardsbacteria bacterium]
MKQIWGIILFVSFSFISMSNSFAIHSRAGTTGLAFLKIGVGARISGMGEASLAVVNDASANFWNPARLTRIEGYSLVLMHNHWIQDINHEYLSLAIPFSKGKRTFSLALTEVTVSGLEFREDQPTAEPKGKFNTYDLSLSGSLAQSLGKDISFGVTFKYLYEKIYLNDTQGWSFDLGTSIIPGYKNLELAGVVQNIGPDMKFERRDFRLPTTFKFGGSYSIDSPHLRGQFLLASDFVKPIDNFWHLNLGTEYNYQKRYFLRVGHKLGHDSEGFTAGVGYKMKSYLFDYAFVPHRLNLGTSHRFSLGLKF